jgi:hypothetical protein
MPFHSFWVYLRQSQRRIRIGQGFNVTLLDWAHSLTPLTAVQDTLVQPHGRIAIVKKLCTDVNFTFPQQVNENAVVASLENNCVHSLKLCIGSAMYISTLRCVADKEPLQTVR